jgi:phage-related protein
MYKLSVENKYGQQIELTNNKSYVIKSISGLSPADATINTTRSAGMDGATFNSSYVGERTITLTMAINGPAEDNRLNLYKYFKPKQPITLYFSNDTRDVQILGYVRAVNIEFFAKKQVAQIEILCPDIYFSDIDDIVVDFISVTSLFEFPFSIGSEGVAFSSIATEVIKNIIIDGDVETGGIFELRARGAVINPMVYNVETNEYIKINYTMAEGDRIVINTNTNHKSVTLYSGTTVTSIVGNVVSGSTWLQFLPADNLISYTADSLASYLDLVIETTNRYEGV